MEETMNLTIDARKKECPLPVIETKKALESMTESGMVQVVVDNEIASQNVLKLAAHKGLEASCEHTEDGNFTVRIQNKLFSAIPHPQDENSENAASVQTPASTKKTSGSTGDASVLFSSSPFLSTTPSRPAKVVVISSDTMGDGDKELGKVLIKSFFFALTKQDVLPLTILFYNRGAFLTCQDSECLNDIRTLEKQGVEILTCGTCLDYYHLKEKLAVGGISNMYEIVEKQLLADTILKP